MRNLMNYLKQYGNKAFSEFKFNEIDGLILTEITYFSIEYLMNEDTIYTIEDLFIDDNLQNLIIDTFSPKKNIKLMKLIRMCSRFNKAKIVMLRNKFSYNSCEQFYALTYIFQNFMYVAYRGTDLTFLGWKENFNMSYLNEIPSQRDAVIYLMDVYKKYNMPFYVGGHSKGGNLAVYAAMYCAEDVKKNIIEIHNFDGPGFYKDITKTKEFLELQDKMITVTTKAAIVGLLLYHTKNISIINARSVSILAHEPYNWEVTKDGKFKRIKKNTIASRWFQRTVRIFFHLTTEKERENFVNLLFKLILRSEKIGVNDFRRHPIKFMRDTKIMKKTLTLEEQGYLKVELKKVNASVKLALKYKLKEMKTGKKDDYSDLKIEDLKIKGFD